jgi:hypothetical protein
MIIDIVYYLFTGHMLLSSPYLQGAGSILDIALFAANVVLAIYFCWYLKENPQEIPDLNQIPSFDGFPNPTLARKIFWAIELWIMHMMFYYMWSHDWWHMPNWYWLEMYVYWWFSGYVLYRWRKNEVD